MHCESLPVWLPNLPRVSGHEKTKHSESGVHPERNVDAPSLPEW
jgi:hypothetical protein